MVQGQECGEVAIGLEQTPKSDRGIKGFGESSAMYCSEGDESCMLM